MPGKIATHQVYFSLNRYIVFIAEAGMEDDKREDRNLAKEARDRRSRIGIFPKCPANASIFGPHRTGASSRIL